MKKTDLSWEKIGANMWVAGNFQIVRQGRGFSCRYKNREFVWTSGLSSAKDECNAVRYAQLKETA